MEQPESGVSGLQMLLAVVTLLFVIGLVVFIFVLMSGGLSEATSSSVSGTATNEQVANFTDAGSPLTVVNLNNLDVSNMVVEGCI